MNRKETLPSWISDAMMEQLLQERELTALFQTDNLPRQLQSKFAERMRWVEEDVQLF